jgi:predicted permease
MERVRSWVCRAGEIVLRGRRERRLQREIEHHLDLLTDDLKRNGLSDSEARLAARREFGGIDRVRLMHREQRGLPILEALVQDLRFALRVLVRDRGFALTAMLVLGVGLGVNNMFFTLFYAHKVRGVPIADAERVLFVSTFDDPANDRLLSIPEYEGLAGSQTSFRTLGGYVTSTATVADEGRAADRFDAAYAAASTWEVLGISPAIGRLPESVDDQPGRPPVVLLGADAWRLRYASDPDVIGRGIIVNGTPATVIGIIRERSGFPSTASVWLPLGQFPEWTRDRSVRSMRVIGRLREGVTEETARGEIETIFGRFETAFPDTNRNVRARVVPLNVRLLGSLDGWMQFIFAGVIVILVACANVANLMFARALHRAPEIAIRRSLGASRRRVIGQLMIEAAVVAGGGAVVGAMVAVAGVRMVQSGIPAGILPYWLDYTMDGTVFFALVAIAVASTVVFGILPALHASRTDVNRTLKDGGRSATASPAMQVWTNAFLAVQLALAMILLAQVALASYLANRSIPTDRNINTTAVVTAAVTLPAAMYPDASSRIAFFARLDERLKKRPEITDYSRTAVLPGEAGGPQQRLQFRGREHPTDSQGPSVLTIEVAPRHFTTLALGILRGREFTESDGSTRKRVAIVNERFAQVFGAGGDPLNVEIAVTPPSAAATAALQWLTIVGIAPTIRHQGTGGSEEQPPIVYLPLAASAPPTSTLLVRHRADPKTAAAILRTEAQAVDANVPLYRVRTLEQAVRDAQWTRHTSVVLADTVTWMSVLLAIVGLYAVTAQRVILKTREIGLRMALGARPPQIAVTAMAGVRVALVLGLLLGTAGAMAWDGAYSSGLNGVYASAPQMLLKVAALLSGIVLVSCAVPIWHAMRTNPVTALRHE